MENVFIVCHGCYLKNHMPQMDSNIMLHFDTKMDVESCSYEPNIDFNTSAYPHTEPFKHDYLLSFDDPRYVNKDITLFGIFIDNKLYEINNITNGEFKEVLLSTLINHIRKSYDVSHFYCSFCRNQCTDEDISNATTELAPLTLSSQNDYKLEDIEFDINDFQNFGDIQNFAFDDIHEPPLNDEDDHPSKRQRQFQYEDPFTFDSSVFDFKFGGKRRKLNLTKKRRKRKYSKRKYSNKKHSKRKHSKKNKH
jgi:hypothetical protein